VLLEGSVGGKATKEPPDHFAFDRIAGVVKNVQVVALVFLVLAVLVFFIFRILVARFSRRVQSELEEGS